MIHFLFFALLNLNNVNSFSSEKKLVLAKLNCSSICNTHELDLNDNDTSFKTGWYFVVDSIDGIKHQLYKSTSILYLNPIPILTTKEIRRTEIYESSLYGKNYYGIIMYLNKEGTEKLSSITTNSEKINITIGFVLENRLLVIRVLDAPISNGIIDINRGDFTIQDAENFKKGIEISKQHISRVVNSQVSGASVSLVPPNAIRHVKNSQVSVASVRL